MDFSYSSEQSMLRDSAASFAKKGYGFEAHLDRLGTDHHFDESTWMQFADLGWLALPLPEEAGGLNGAGTELSLICEELGAGMVLEPIIASQIFPATLLKRAALESQFDEFLAPMASGERRYAVAWAESRRLPRPDDCETTASKTAEGYLLSGKKFTVLNGPNATHIIVTARILGTEGDGLSLFVLEPSALGIDLEPFKLMGGGVAAHLNLDKVAVRAHALIGTPGQSLNAVNEALDMAVLCSSAQALGAMRRLLFATQEYLKVRKQFGVPIGSFQALQHRVVDMFIEYEQSRSMVMKASVSMQDPDPPEREKVISACKIYLDKAATLVAQQAVQLHGGIGVTEELDVGHLFRQLTAYRQLYTNTEFHMQRLETLLLGSE